MRIGRWPMPDNPTLPPRWRRLYAHVVSLEAACPRCGTMTGVIRGKHNPAYDRKTAIYHCGVCGGRWYVGVIFWPAKGRSVRPEDHVPRPGEAAELRRLYSAVTDERVAGTRRDGADIGRRRAQVNLGCTCGECPVHQLGGGDEDDV